jgi:hypothetical protein
MEEKLKIERKKNQESAGYIFGFLKFVNLGM